MGTHMTQAQLLNLLDPQGNPLVVAKVLSQTNKIFKDAPFFESNGQFNHTVGYETGLPTGVLRALNEGVVSTTDETQQLVEGICMIDAASKIDVKMLPENSEKANVIRMNKADRFIRGMGKRTAQEMIYGNRATTPKGLNGFATRLNDLSNFQTCIQGAAAGDQNLTSVYVVIWGSGMAYCVYPEGDPFVGVRHIDGGKQYLTGANGTGEIWQWLDTFECHFGIVVEDISCIGRYCNIGTGSGATNTFNEDVLIELINLMADYDDEGPQGAIYMNRTLMTQAEIATKDKNTVTNFSYSTEEDPLAGPRRILRFKGLPVRRVDQITVAESQVPA